MFVQEMECSIVDQTIGDFRIDRQKGAEHQVGNYAAGQVSSSQVVISISVGLSVWSRRTSYL